MQQKFLHFGIVRVPLGHIIAGSKTFVIHLLQNGAVSSDDEPIVIDGLFPFPQNVLKLFAQTAAMIEHGVQKDLYPTFVRAFHQFFQIPVRAEHCVDFFIVDRIILVIARRLKDRR